MLATADARGKRIRLLFPEMERQKTGLSLLATRGTLACLFPLTRSRFPGGALLFRFLCSGFSRLARRFPGPSDLRRRGRRNARVWPFGYDYFFLPLVIF